jgi:hypothetical protein
MSISNQEHERRTAAMPGSDGGPSPSPQNPCKGRAILGRGGAPAPLGMVIGAGAVHAHQGVMQGWARLV